MAKKIEFPRKTYDKVRKMDHAQMANYFQGVYNSGYDIGAKEAKPTLMLDYSGLESQIKDIKGVGGSKAVLIMDVVKRFVEEQV